MHGSFGAQDYSMRIWLRPDQAWLNTIWTPGDVATALREQNAQFAAGPHLAPTRAPEVSRLRSVVSTPGRMSTPEEFERIILPQ